MNRRRLPPERPAGSLDLLDDGPTPSPRDGESPNDWRADALGGSRHSRLASEMREPLDDADPERAERLCAEVTRNALGDLAPALLLLSSDRRRRAQVLTAWTVALFDLALRPGLAGLDGDRLAQINAWEFRSEEALDGSAPGQPVFVMLAREERSRPWNRDALDEIVAHARRQAVGPQRRHGLGNAVGEVDLETQTAVEKIGRRPELGRALLAALFGAPSQGHGESADLAPLVAIAIEMARRTAPPSEAEPLIETLQAVRAAAAPPGWRRAIGYVRRALLAKLGRSSMAEPLGLGSRLLLLARSALG